MICDLKQERLLFDICVAVWYISVSIRISYLTLDICIRYKLQLLLSTNLCT